MLTQLLVLASEGAEGIPGDHIASKLAVPLGILFFCGAVFLLLWSNYGAKKGALIYSTAMFGFTTMLGVFWWFGAPGTPVATGLQNFPGQAPDAYTAHWFPFEPGSEREAAVYDGGTAKLADFQDVQTFLGLEGASAEDLETTPSFGVFTGDSTQAGQLMVELHMREQDGTSQLGGQRRAQYTDAATAGLADAGANPNQFERADPFFTAAIQDDTVLLDKRGDTLLAGATVTVTATFVNQSGERQEIVVDEAPMFAFKQDSNLWFPSAVWTFVSLLLFVISLLALDRIEQREKKALEEVQEPERLAVPIRQ